jgi:hypothetical protein
MQGFLGQMFAGGMGQLPKQPVQHMQMPDPNQQFQQPQFQWGGQGMFQQPQGMFNQGQNMFPQRPQFGSYQNWAGGSPSFDESNGRRSAWGGW